MQTTAQKHVMAGVAQRQTCRVRDRTGPGRRSRGCKLHRHVGARSGRQLGKGDAVL